MPVVLAHVGGVTIAPLQLLPIAIVGAGYAVRARHLADDGRPVPPWRQACFGAGLLAILVTLVSPAAHLSDELVVAHMGEHLVIGDLGPLLIVLGLTGPMLQPLLSVRRLGWLRVLANPLVAFPLWAADLYLWHVPALYQAALNSGALHALQHACFAGFGIAMWMALLGPLPKPAWFGNGARLVYIVGVRFGGAVLGNVLAWSGSALYPDYASGEAHWHLSALADQGAAGVVMMVEGGLVTLGLFAWVFFRAAREGEERQRLIDLAADRGIELDERRAARAVAAGQGELLERRLLEASGNGAEAAQGAPAGGP
jgi:cytochrome c oxidase assembly factor CtaG